MCLSCLNIIISYYEEKRKQRTSNENVFQASNFAVANCMHEWTKSFISLIRSYLKRIGSHRCHHHTLNGGTSENDIAQKINGGYVLKLNVICSPEDKISSIEEFKIFFVVAERYRIIFILYAHLAKFFSKTMRKRAKKGVDFSWQFFPMRKKTVKNLWTNGRTVPYVMRPRHEKLDSDNSKCYELLCPFWT